MSDSQPPPSDQIPGASSGAGLYLAGILILAAMTAGLLYWRFRERPPQVVQMPAASTVKAAPVDPGAYRAPPPPPPPPIEALRPSSGGQGAALGGKPAAIAAPSAAPSTAASSSSPAPAEGPGPCSACGDGQPSGALTAALQNAASGARACYNRALRTSEVSGSINVAVQVGSTGAVCGASITKDTVGSAEISSCVLAKFRGKSFPAPQSGCVVVNIPIRFEIKQ